MLSLIHIFTLRKLKVVGNKPLQAFKCPQEDTLGFSFHLLCKIRIVSSVPVSYTHLCDTLKRYAVNGIIANADNKRLKENLASAEKTVSIWKQQVIIKTRLTNWQVVKKNGFSLRVGEMMW